MALDTFVPEVWSSSILAQLDHSTVYAEPGVTVNTDYEGDIQRGGDTVHITSVVRPAIAAYNRGTTVIDPQQLTTTDQTLVVNQAKFFAFEVDDLDKAQTANAGALMVEANREVGQGLAEDIDVYVSGAMKAAVTGAGTIATATIDFADNGAGNAAFKVLQTLAVRLDAAKVSRMGRFVVVTPEFHALLAGDQRFTDASAYGAGASALVTGEVGRALGFTIKTSTLAPTGVPANSRLVIAGTPRATTFARGIPAGQVYAYRPESSFSDAVKGLSLYGAKVIRPTELVAAPVVITGS